jgi:hypothetical protein
MLALMLGTIILALTYGALWHNRPARRQNEDGGDDLFSLGRLVILALEWLALIPHVSSSLQTKESVSLAAKGAVPKQTQVLRPVVRPRRLSLWKRILSNRSAVEASMPGNLFKVKAHRQALHAKL